MARVVVIHWDPAEAAPVCDRLRREGIEAAPYPHRGTKGLCAVTENPPDAIVIDLLSMPSYGRSMGALLRERKSTRAIPLVFIAGDPEKTERVRELLPDAIVADLLRIAPAVRRAIRRPPVEPVIPEGSGTPLLQKLRIREGAAVALLHAPEGFEASLAPLPEGVRIRAGIQDADVILAFVKSAAALGRELPGLAREMGKGRTLWLCWPKKAAGGASDLSMPRIREMCQEVGLTDYKVCAVDAIWSGIAVGLRRKAGTRKSGDR
jgi:CheY-like chemotaxis protein